jgi:L-alanine-DL-glutamate epimerase-like enolase superfamily enzyme
VGVLNFDELLAEQLCFEDGHVIVPERPGHGIRLDPDAVKHFQVA